MKKRDTVLKGWALAATMLLSGAASAQTMAPTIYIWDAGGVGQAKPASWGNGDAKEATERGGASVLNITTRNFYEGARFDFQKPVTLDPYREDGYLRLRVRFGSASSGRGGRGAGMPGMEMPGMGMPGMGMPGMPGGGMMPGGMPGMGGGMPGMPTTGAMPSGMGGMPDMGGMSRRGRRGRVVAPVLNQMQAIVMLDKGALFGRIEIDPKARPASDGFQILMVRLKDMRPTPGAEGAARRLILTGDKEATFALGQASFVVESDDVAVSIRRESDPVGTQSSEITVRPNMPFNLVADVEAGISDVEVSWNFDADNAGLPLPKSNTGRGGGMPGGYPGAMPGMPGGGMPMGMPGAMPGGMPGMGMPGMPGGGTMPGMGGAAPAERVDATGLSAQLKFPNEEQDYRVEVTVHDRSGKKEDAKASILVHVRAS